MSDATLRGLLATAAVFVIVAAAVFLAVQGSSMYNSYQNEQSASLDRDLAQHNMLIKQLERRYNR